MRVKTILGCGCLCLLSSIVFAENGGTKTIEEAIIATGGTVGVISRPGDGQRFVNQAMEQGLTARDRTGQGIIPKLKQIGMIRDGNINSYHYQGKKGEKIRIAVRSQDLKMAIRLFDANGQYLNVSDNPDGNGEVFLEQVLPYRGAYEIAVLTYQAHVSGQYTIEILSDESSVAAPAVWSDKLREGGTYPIRELKKNAVSAKREFGTEAYFVQYIENKCPPCPGDALCKPCAPSLLVFADDNQESGRDQVFKREDAFTVEEGRISAGQLKLGGRYHIRTNVENLSRTDIADNRFEIIEIR